MIWAAGLRRMLVFVSVVGVAAVGSAVVGAGSAYAQVAPEPVSRSVTGASATCTVQSDLSAISCDLTDTKADKSSVFIQWALDRDETRWANKNGSNPPDNVKPFSEGGLNKDNTASTISWRVCVDKNLRGDSCSNSVVVEGVNRPLEFVCPPPSASIPPDLQHPPNCYPVEPDPRFSELDKCAAGLGLALIGLGKEGQASSSTAKQIAKEGGRVTLRKLGPVGWGLTIAGVATAVSECNP